MLLDPLQSRVLIADALGHRYAVLAVNADSPAAITDCLEAARICQAPIIIEASLWQLTGHSFGAGDPILGLGRYLAQIAVLAESERFRDVPIVFHTDHIKGVNTRRILSSAILGVALRTGEFVGRLSASTVSLDSSEMTAEQNIEMIGSLCQLAADAGLPATLEMEAGVDDGVTPLAVAENLLGAVQRKYPGYVWLWAPGLGSRHGFSAGGFPEFRPDAAGEHRQLARKILGRDIGIALHGSSGLPESQIRDAVAAGVVKVNWSSESLLLRSAAAAGYYTENAAALEKSHPKFKATAMDNGLQTWISARYVPAVCDRIRLLGGENAAPRLMAKLAPGR
jgi:fructose-bisphosphate aldolase class II